MVLPTPSMVLGMEPVGIAWEPKEVSSWKMGQIHFVVWPNNFLSCQFIEKLLGRGKQNKKAHLTSFNTACVVLISHAFWALISCLVICHLIQFFIPAAENVFLQFPIPSFIYPF